MKTVTKRSALPWYGAAAVCLLFALSGNLYKPMQYLICAAAAAGVWFIIYKIAPAKQFELDEVQKTRLSGIADVDKMLSAAAAHLTSAQSSAKTAALYDADFAKRASALVTSGRKILDRTADNPEKAHHIRRILNYYIPTLDKLLSAHNDFCQNGIGEQTAEQIKSAVYAMEPVFDKHFDKLFADIELDISTDIDTLETMLASEGLREFEADETNSK